MGILGTGYRTRKFPSIKILLKKISWVSLIQAKIYFELKDFRLRVPSCGEWGRNYYQHFLLCRLTTVFSWRMVVHGCPTSCHEEEKIFTRPKRMKYKYFTPQIFMNVIILSFK